MNFFKALFHKEKRKEIPPMPPWSEIVEIMYDKSLGSFVDEVVSVVYSGDRTMRYVILKDKKGHFTYQLETIYQFYEYEWQYICSGADALPAMWKSVRGSGLFAYETDLLKEMRSEPEYKQYFK
ncbi:MAG: hypothetical protein J1F23_05375 [Oscillospiraceae bacterium]|nr:hypothetical protein [Oscillospiraceae bacterium]